MKIDKGATNEAIVWQKYFSERVREIYALSITTDFSGSADARFKGEYNVYALIKYRNICFVYNN